MKIIAFSITHYGFLRVQHGDSFKCYETTLELLQQACKLVRQSEDGSEKQQLLAKKELKKPSLKKIEKLAWDISKVKKVAKDLQTKGFCLLLEEEASIIFLNQAKVSKNMQELIKVLAKQLQQW